MPEAAVKTPLRAIDELAQSQPLRECFQWLSREKQWVNQQHLELCRIPSPTFLEQARAESMAGRLQALGLIAKIDRAGNVVAQSQRRATAPLVALTAHLDTVLSPRNGDDIRVDGDGRFRGPGVADNGAGLAALLALARALSACPGGEEYLDSLLFVANVGEEGEGNLSGMRYLCQQSRLASKIDSYVVLDGPAIDFVTCQALASRRFEIAFQGPGGHSWSDFGAGNPVHALGRTIALFADLVAAAEAQLRGLRYSFNFGVIEGGASVNSIPTHARAKLDLRSENEAVVDHLTSLMGLAVERALEAENGPASGSRLTARIREIGSRPGGRLLEDAPLFQSIRSVDRYLGIRSHLDCSSTDANIPLSMGLPAISIGAGGQGGGAHTPSEWYHPEGRDVGLRRILLLAAVLVRQLYLR